ncbi:carbonic anhydrase [Haloplanus aerogenes]|uniref:carbonic anhydrase n=1 Tax=Haloplanus aerogenes TaxID=660522 RepID=A0A3M0CY50_9EURY|nr:carbonic anhydrase [Haloplanus aerogenes]AZH25063.1 IcfA [Haloplanus aerogenes]RMB13717.1 carbonic anhydrase [Haloplanus aerogenes]
MHRTVVELLRGNETHTRAYDSHFDDVQESQHPDVVTVCCSDSRVLQDLMWGNDEPGNIFTCGNIGNRVVQTTEAGEVVSGDVLYPLAYLDTEVALVVGHTGCGAVTAAYDDLTDGIDAPPGVRHCLDLLTPHLDSGLDSLPSDLDRPATINRLVEYNVDWQVAFLRESDEVPDSVDIVGCVYDFQDAYPGQRGEIHVVNVDGERAAETLRKQHPEIEGRIDRLWEY